MSLYTVVWAIEIEAGSPEDAVRMGRVIQQDRESQATTFHVRRHEGSTIDLEELGFDRVDVDEVGEWEDW